MLNHEAQVLALANTRGSLTETAVVEATHLGRPAVRALLKDLADRNLLRRSPTQVGVFSPLPVFKPMQVQEAWVQQALAGLERQRTMTLGGVATRLSLSLEEAEQTMLALERSGLVEMTVVGHALVYRLNRRSTAYEEKGAQVLSLLKRRGGATLGGVATKLSLAPAAAERILLVLEQCGLVQTTEEGQALVYRLSPLKAPGRVA